MKSCLQPGAIPWRAGALLLFIYFGSTLDCLAQQEADTTKRETLKEKLNTNKGVQKIVEGLTRKPPKEPINEKSEEPFLPYEGKIIRKIVVQHLGFETTILDTTRTLKNFITRGANRLHPNTHEYVIRNYLFIKEGKPLNPYRVADNERTIRNLDFMMDARIYVKPISQNADSVDLVVVTRDVFSIGVSFNADIPTQYYLGIRDLNLVGLGQRYQVSQVLETTRNPHYGYQGSYQWNNISGTFIDALAGFTAINEGVSLGYENEQSLYFKLSRALYQPFARFAGEASFSDNRSTNVYSEPDSSFSQYRYQMQDYWIGYSLGNKNLPNDLRENRNRKFIAVRAYEQYFINSINTDRTEPDRFAYRNRVALLAQFTFFRQDFYKTQYVVGFGRTEDIPYGYRISFTTGWEKELGNKRPYAGGELSYNYVRPMGTIIGFNAMLGLYWDRNKVEDALVSIKGSRYSRIYKMNRFIVRHRNELGYAILINQDVKQGININDLNGLLGFKPDSLIGNQRLTFSQEELVFTPWKVLGFRTAIVVRTDFSLIQRTGRLFESQNFFSGFSFGIRTRNENLVFNTIEMRLFFYPKTVEQINPYLFKVNSNFRIRYPTNLVNKPATVFN